MYILKVQLALNPSTKRKRCIFKSCSPKAMIEVLFTPKICYEVITMGASKSYIHSFSRQRSRQSVGAFGVRHDQQMWGKGIEGSTSTAKSLGVSARI
jgi:hypothetical protein